MQYVLLFAMVVVVIAGALVTVAERGAASANILTLSDGLWWAVTTVTTVGYGDRYPTTSMGRGIGVALMLLGITLF
jgi:voltage-gated potassium channel